MNTTLSGILFEWDDQKDNLNKQKHGLSFTTAAHVFFDEDRLEFYDAAHSVDEDRFITIGKVSEVLFVVFTERESPESIRLISARVATAKERRLYYGDETNDSL